MKPATKAFAGRSYSSSAVPICRTAAAVHHHQPVGDGQRLLLVVRDEQRGQAEPLLQRADLDPHLRAQLGVEIGQRLIEQETVPA